VVPSQTFHDHIKELRRRILWVVVSIGVSGGIAYALRVRLINLLQHPLGAPLFYTSPAGSFNFVIKLSMMIGVFIALPVMIYQLLRFVEPALPHRLTKGFMVKVIGASFLLALAGIGFGYFFMIPLSLKFFASYSTPAIKPLISANEYLSYMTSNLIIFALVFQIPLIVLFINWIKPIKPGKFLRYQRHVIVGAFAFAIILPFTYDPISQFVVAIPIIVLYYLSAILLLVANRRPGQAFAPVASVTPVPVPAPAVQPVLMPPLPQPTVRRPLFAMDGFSTSRRLGQAGSMVAAAKVAKSPTTTHKMPQPSRHQGLTMDGIIRPMPSSSL